MQRQGPSEDAATNAACVKKAGDFCIPPYTEMAARVRSDRAGLSIIRPIKRERNTVFVASGLVELVADRPWVTLVSKFLSDLVTVFRRQELGLAEEHSAIFVAMKQEKSTGEMLQTSANLLDHLEVGGTRSP
jgi:hypothetical protein